MKLSLICTGLGLLALSSCSTAYRTGQTPDDVYYSPAREVDEYVVATRTEPRYSGGDDFYEDRFIRMRMLDRMRWSSLDFYYNNPYAFSPYNYYHSWNTPWNSYWAWNNFYNPYCNLYFGGGWGGWGSWGGNGPIAVINPKTTIRPSRALVFNPASYNPPSNSRGMSKYSNMRYYGADNGSRYNNTNSSGLGNSMRRVFNNNNNNSSGYGTNNNTRTSNNNTPTRTYNPSSSSSSSSSGRSSGGSSGGGVSRPIR
ncbi:MAG: hypothetical protein ACK4E0_18810 [Chitinophagaceae bacterium]|jgi:hypothetical protein